MWICFPLVLGRDDDPLARVRVQQCFEIPLILPPSLKDFRRPQPFWTLGEKAVDVAQDLQILASIAVLARDLSPEFGRTVQAGIEQAAYSIREKLPEGVELHFREQTVECAE